MYVNVLFNLRQGGYQMAEKENPRIELVRQVLQGATPLQRMKLRQVVWQNYCAGYVQCSIT
jgi:hypothetical protein